MSVRALSFKHKALRPEDFDQRVAMQQQEQCDLDAVLGMTSAIEGIQTAIQAKAASGSQDAPLLPAPRAAVQEAEVRPNLPTAPKDGLPVADPANEDAFRFASRFNLR